MSATVARAAATAATLRGSRTTHASSGSRAARVVVRAGKSQKEELAEMRAAVQLANMNPSQENVISAILDLAKQEFGLAGVKFNEVMDKVGECYAFTPCQYVSGKGTALETVNPRRHQLGLAEDVLLRAPARPGRGLDAAPVLRALQGRARHARRGQPREHQGVHAERMGGHRLRGRRVPQAQGRHRDGRGESDLGPDHRRAISVRQIQPQMKFHRTFSR